MKDEGQQTTEDGLQIMDDRQHQLNNGASKLNEPIANCSRLKEGPTANYIWLEDESQRIGNLQIPMPLWRTMRSSKVYFFDIPFEERLNYLTQEYGVQKKRCTSGFMGSRSFTIHAGDRAIAPPRA